MTTTAERTRAVKPRPRVRSTSRAASVLGQRPEEVSEVEGLRLHGLEIRKSRESAVAFLKGAGILDRTGKLAKPYRD